MKSGTSSSHYFHGVTPAVRCHCWNTVATTFHQQYNYAICSENNERCWYWYWYICLFVNVISCHKIQYKFTQYIRLGATKWDMRTLVCRERPKSSYVHMYRNWCHLIRLMQKGVYPVCTQMTSSTSSSKTFILLRFLQLPVGLQFVLEWVSSRSLPDVVWDGIPDDYTKVAYASFCCN